MLYLDKGESPEGGIFAIDEEEEGGVLGYDNLAYVRTLDGGGIKKSDGVRICINTINVVGESD